jgi:hypothetical protein
MTRPDSPRPEPVAWQKWDDTGASYGTEDDKDFAEEWARGTGENGCRRWLIPLYPHPSAAAGQPSGDSGTLAHEPVSNAYPLPPAPVVPVVTITDEMVEAALRYWFLEPEDDELSEYWETDVIPQYTDRGEGLRKAMRRALTAALTAARDHHPTDAGGE